MTQLLCCMQTTGAGDKLQSLIGPLPDGLSFERWLKGRPLICISFGSMGNMGFISDPSHLVGMLIAALHQVQAKGILLTGAVCSKTPACLLPFSLLLCNGQMQKGAPH